VEENIPMKAAASQITIQEEMIKAAMVACMARSGYLQQS
jgi:hypothetical protein